MLTTAIKAVEEEIVDALARSGEIMTEVRNIALASSISRPAPPAFSRIRPENGPGDVAAVIEHTLLRADATENDVANLCREAALHRFGAVCVNSSWVSAASQALACTGVIIAAVVGFPLGAASTFSKAAETADAVCQGADEIDMVINIGLLKSGLFAGVLLDIAAVVVSSSGRPVKAILETCLLDERQKIAGCLLARAAGAAFVKTSTGFSTGGATEDDVRLLKRAAGAGMGVKASGGVRTLADLKRMLAAGATRIGTSSSLKIVEEAHR